ncbi:NADPH:quinone reductase [Corynebacterium suranareeae]|uniref:NADPH:quinone reductase n=1 Tax=Corynebacterium suranareeae TaxID=2506452 RepID=A0A160PRV5_9CORY|nr:zinc-binding alcohol dehydrogenase family protein [Corynebacterium suranareeae]BAU96406.1 NADPH:quinone reductase [Corynebacterium suranareeae]
MTQVQENVPELMRALVTREVGSEPIMDIADVPVPKWRPGYSLIRVKAASINQLSNTIRKGGFGHTPVPLIQGNDGAGTIVTSERYPAGTRVSAIGGNTFGITEDGMFAEYALIPDGLVTPISANLKWSEAGAFGINFLTAYGAIQRAGGVSAGQNVLITGATGGVGNALVQTVSALGAKPIAVVSTEKKAEYLRDSGIITIDLSTDNVVEKVSELTDSLGVTLVLDPVGGPLFPELQRSLSRQGTLVSIGFTAGNTPQVDLLDLIAGDKRILGYSVNDESESWVSEGLAAIADLAERGLLKPRIDSTVTLANFEEGYARLISRRAVGSIVAMID